MSALLELVGVSGGYGPVTVLRDLHLRVDEGHVAVVLGANGAGKTTTLRAVSGMIHTSGHIRFDGSTLAGRADKVSRLGIAHVPQGRGTFSDLTVEDNLRLGANNRRDRAAINADLDTWLERFPQLGLRRNQEAGRLSGGEQQMLALARAMMSRPRLLLLDEPSLGLAPLVTRELFARLGELNREEGLTMLVVEQNANLALDIGHWGYVLEAGHIAVEGSAQQLHGDEAVRKAYLGF